MFRFTFLYFIFITSFGVKELYGQNSNGDTSAYQYFIHYDEDTTLDTLTEYLEDLNSNEVWKDGNLHLALWEINSFPFTLGNGAVVLNINDVIRQTVRKTKISEATFNILSAADDITNSAAGSCFDPLDFSISQDNKKDITICIIDTGIDADIKTSTTGTYNYNLINYEGHDYVHNDNIPDDEHGHGTHIAGIIHSITNGVDSLGAKILFNIKKTHNAQGQALMSHIVKALIDAVDEDANIVNMSFGRTDTFNIDSFFPLRLAIQYAQTKDVLVVASAGNDSKNIDILTNTTIPAAFPEGNIVSVAALKCDNSLSPFSNFGKDNADIGTLGVFIPGPNGNGGIRYASGTSQAAAVVSAVSALLATYKNNFNPIALKCALLNGSTKISSLNNQLFSGGKLNTNGSLAYYQSSQNNYVVTNANTSGNGSLRFALEEVCGVKNIGFNPSLNGQTLNIIDKEIFIDSPIHLNGNGQISTLINGQNLRAFNIGFNGNLTIKDLTISNTNSSNGTILNKGNLTVDLNATIK